MEDKNLNELEEIGEEITHLENRLGKIPGTEWVDEQNTNKLDTSSADQNKIDMSKYNRKQRRQIQRRLVRNEKQKMSNAEQKGNTFVTRREFVGLFQSAQKIRDRLYYVDVLTGAIEKLLIEKNIITEDELRNKIKTEAEKAMAFQEIQKTEKDYENRLKKLMELQIDPNMSVVGQQLYEDPDVSLDEKKRLAKEYNLEVLLKIFDNKSVDSE